MDKLKIINNVLSEILSSFDSEIAKQSAVCLKKDEETIQILKELDEASGQSHSTSFDTPEKRAWWRVSFDWKMNCCRRPKLMSFEEAGVDEVDFKNWSVVPVTGKLIIYEGQRYKVIGFFVSSGSFTTGNAKGKVYLKKTN
jgi:hypothetical protein